MAPTQSSRYAVQRRRAKPLYWPPNWGFGNPGWADSMQGLSDNIDEAQRVVSTVPDQLVRIARRKGHDV
jgi:hypothetical protein